MKFILKKFLRAPKRYIRVADKPFGDSGMQLDNLSAKALRQKFQFHHCETPNYAKHRDLHKSSLLLAKQILAHLAQPLQESLILCPINALVGYGVFTTEAINAGTIVGLYTGKIESSAIGSDYGLSLPEDLPFPAGDWQLNAINEGGITRFIQHMPSGLGPVLKEIDEADQSQFLSYIRGNGIVTYGDLCRIIVPANCYDALSPHHELAIEHQHFQTRLPQCKVLFTRLFYNNALKPEELTALKQLCQIKIKHEFLLYPLCADELSHKPFLQQAISDQRLALANIFCDFIILDDKPWCYFIANRHIAAGQQLGMSYGYDYWSGRLKVPGYFAPDGTILDPSSYLPVPLEALLVKYQDSHDNALITKDQALRRAVRKQAYDDIHALLEYGANPNARSRSQQTSLDYCQALSQQNQRIRHLLCFYGAELLEQ